MNSLKKIGVLSVLATFFVFTGLIAQSTNKKLSSDSTTSDAHFFSNLIKFDKLTLKQKDSFYISLKRLNCISGTVFFSANGFANTVAIQYNGSAEGIQNYFDKCVIGTKITFEKCVFKNSTGSIFNLHKTFLIQ